MGKTLVSLTLFGFGLIWGVVGALFLIDIRHGLDHGDGWATALATIALVAVGVLVPLWQSSSDRKRHREENEKKRLGDEESLKRTHAAMRRAVFRAYRLAHVEIGEGRLYRSVVSDNEGNRRNVYIAFIERRAEALRDFIGGITFNQSIEVSAAEPLFRARAEMLELLGSVRYWVFDQHGIPPFDSPSGAQFIAIKNGLKIALDQIDGRASSIIDALDELDAGQMSGNRSTFTSVPSEVSMSSEPNAGQDAP